MLTYVFHFEKPPRYFRLSLGFLSCVVRSTAIKPKVMEQAPMAVALHGNTVVQAVFHALQSTADECHPAGIIGGGNAVFGDDQIALKTLVYLADYMFQCLRIELIVHLGQLRAFGAGQLAFRPILGAGVILHTKEIIFPDERQIMTELLVPGVLCEGFAAGQGLQIVQ